MFFFSKIARWYYISHLIENYVLFSTDVWTTIISKDMPINDDRLLHWDEQYEKIVTEHILLFGPPAFSGDRTNKEFFFYHNEARHITVWIQTSIFMIAQDIDGWDPYLAVKLISTPLFDTSTFIDPDTGTEFNHPSHEPRGKE